MDAPLILQILPLIIILVILGVIIIAARRRVREEAAHGSGITPGIKGWLLLLAIGLTLAPIRLLIDIAKYYTAPEMASLFRELPLLAYTEAAQNGVLLLAALITLTCLLRKKRGFSIAFYVQYGIGIASLPLNYLVGYLVMRDRGIDAEFFSEEGMVDVGRWVVMIVVGALWVAYVAKSRRVAVTFVN